jgi:trk system potassium uptake protein TrkA
VTNEDEANIMSALLAKKMGAKKTMVLIQRGAYVDLVQAAPSTSPSPPAGHHLGPADPCAPCRHRQRLQPAPRAAEAIEAIAHGDENTSKVVGKTVGELAAPGHHHRRSGAR